ncbi:hypothetical protein MmiHf6_08350 [Methanimicrococcus hongohii]|uniref:Uncharacterized protein n=1 Tax=Methanimicrococcus hongohii TaxID=3028295 RepID=A0AA96ZU78_9EURY|nr:hypothetical protein MmiHf6_08350 [Methanimicrococcus sp. Hf6]
MFRLNLTLYEKTKYRPSIDEFPKRSVGKEEIEIQTIQNEKSKNILHFDCIRLRLSLLVCNCLLHLPRASAHLNHDPVALNFAVGRRCLFPVGGRCLFPAGVRFPFAAAAGKLAAGQLPAAARTAQILKNN